MPDAKYKSGFAAIVGRPNVGKSTLMNHLVGQKIAITSSKPQTTRNRIQTVYTDERGQIVFLDTPGVHKAKNRLGEYMDLVAERTLEEADVILWLTEPVDYIGKGEQLIAQKLSRVKVPVILVMNKIDTVDKSRAAACLDNYRNLCRFDETAAVSAMKGTGLDELIEVIYRYLPYGQPFYDEETVTNETMRDIAAEIVREKALRCLNDEIPHGIAVTIEKMHEREDGSGICDIEAVIICERESHKGIIIGKNGSMLRRIGTSARIDIEKMMEMKVNLKLWVKVRRDWRDNDAMIRSFGYRRKDIG